MRTHSILIAAILATVVAVGAFAANGGPVGRDVARDGAVAELSGTLDHRDEEWFVETDDGSYQLMLGRFGHTKELPFAEGAPVELSGFSVPEYVAPMSVSTDGGTQEFWHEARYPLWAGEGERRNAVSEARGERADDARELALDRKPLGGREDAPRTRQQEPEPEPERTFGRRDSSSAPARGGRR